MTESAIMFAYHLMWGFVISLSLSFFWAKRVATQATLVNDHTGRATTILNFDGGKFGRAWGIYTASGVGITLAVLLLRETHTFLANAGYIG